MKALLDGVHVIYEVKMVSVLKSHLLIVLVNRPYIGKPMYPMKAGHVSYSAAHIYKKSLRGGNGMHLGNSL